MPLGSGALAGSPYKINRMHVARTLGFSKVTENSLDAVSDRDFVVEFQFSCALFMMHMSRLSEEIVLWSSQEFGFVELADAYSTGSSIMPQKKNPDILELVRGKTGRVYGNLLSALTMMKSLPLSYNKDLQEDKEPLFDTVDTVKGVLRILPAALKTMRINKARMREAASGFLTATDAADYLVKKGLPFRRAHEAVGKAVRYSIEKGKTLEDLTLEEWRMFSRLFEADIKRAVKAESSVKARKIRGGTAPGEVRKQLQRARGELGRSPC
jgi:argininosuccinate lyase